MRLTKRDRQLVRDIALSHAMARDQIIAFAYFSSVRRLNARLRLLVSHGFLKRLDTPFFSQGLYAVGPNAPLIVGERIHLLLARRQTSPRFLQHALAVSNIRIALCSNENARWRFEQQATTTFAYGGRTLTVKPDGLALTAEMCTAVEADLGHVAPQKVREKLDTYRAFALSGACRQAWKCERFTVLLITSGALRARRLRRLCPKEAPFDFRCLAHDDFGVAWPGSWS